MLLSIWGKMIVRRMLAISWKNSDVMSFCVPTIPKDIVNILPIRSNKLIECWYRCQLIDFYILVFNLRMLFGCRNTSSVTGLGSDFSLQSARSWHVEFNSVVWFGNGVINGRVVVVVQTLDWL
jgi:hypothetical protein